GICETAMRQAAVWSRGATPVSHRATRFLRKARRVIPLLRHWHRSARYLNTPRWQGNVIDPLATWLGSRRTFSFDGLVKFEWLARRILGQPLSLRAWDRMTFNDKVAYRRLRVRDSAFQT